jgi:hypothetical protein
MHLTEDKKAAAWHPAKLGLTSNNLFPNKLVYSLSFLFYIFFIA